MFNLKSLEKRVNENITGELHIEGDHVASSNMTTFNAISNALETSTIATGATLATTETKRNNFKLAVLNNDLIRAHCLLQTGRVNPDETIDEEKDISILHGKLARLLPSSHKPESAKMNMRLLQVACSNKYTEMVVLLLKFGADTSDIDFTDIRVTSKELSRGRFIYEAQGLAPEVMKEAIEIQQERLDRLGKDEDLKLTDDINKIKELGKIEALELVKVDRTVNIDSDVFENNKTWYFYKILRKKVFNYLCSCFALAPGYLARNQTEAERKISAISSFANLGVSFIPNPVISGSLNAIITMGQFLLASGVDKSISNDANRINGLFYNPKEEISPCTRTLAYLLTRSYRKYIEEACESDLDNEALNVENLLRNIFSSKSFPKYKYDGKLAGYNLFMEILNRKSLFNNVDPIRGKINPHYIKSVEDDGEKYYDALSEEEARIIKINFKKLVDDVFAEKLQELKRGGYYISNRKANKAKMAVVHWLENNLNRTMNVKESQELRKKLSLLFEKSEKVTAHPILTSIWHPISSSCGDKKKKSVNVNTMVSNMKAEVELDGDWSALRIRMSLV